MASPILQYVDQGSYVEELQRLLNEKLPTEDRVWKSGDISVNGKFGPHTRYYVERYQSSARLKVDGVVGPMTWAALRGIEKYNCFDEPEPAIRAADDFTCWAAGTAMLKKLPNPDTTKFSDVAVETQTNGKVGGLYNSDENMKKFAKHHNFGAVTGQIITCAQLGGLLTMFGRLMLNIKGAKTNMKKGNSNDSHLVILGGLRGDGTPKGTTLTLFDTSPHPFDPILVASFSSFNYQYAGGLTYQCFYAYSNTSAKKILTR